MNFEKTFNKKVLIIFALFFALLAILKINTASASEKIGIYTEEEGYIVGILPETSLEKFISNLNTEKNVVVRNSSGNQISNNEFVGSGMQLQLDNSNYKLSVLGDLSGDGKITITDLVKLNLHSVSIKTLEEDYLRSADLNNDGKITITDLVQSNLVIVDILDIEDVNSNKVPTTPTVEPTATPTVEPTETPTVEPTATPTVEPTETPTVEPTATPTVEPTATPTVEPTETPTVEPTATPTVVPTETPTVEPSATPTVVPTETPTVEPSVPPTSEPEEIGIYVTLYNDGTLALASTSEYLEEENVEKSFGNIYDLEIKQQEDIPWKEYREDILKLDLIDEVSPKTCAYWFYQCINLREINNIDKLNVSETTDMTNMFRECNSLVDIDLSMFDTRNVTDMSYMFYNCINLENINFVNEITGIMLNSQITFMASNDIEERTNNGFDTSKVIDMSYMFYGCASLNKLNLTSFDTKAAENMSSMFENCTNIEEISAGENWSTIEANTTNMFNGCSINSVTQSGITGVFAKLYDDGSLVFTSTDRIIEGKTLVKSYQNMSEVELYRSGTAPWYVDRADIASIDFEDKVQPKSTAYWFSACDNVIQINNIANLDTSRVTDMSEMFSDCYSITELDLSSLNTSNVTNMYSMFCNCFELKTLNISNIDTSNVIDMSYMFMSCSELEELDLSSFNTSNVTYMSGMFQACSKLETLDVSSFDTSNVTDMDVMFRNCGFTTLDLTNFDTTNVTTMNSMFEDSSFIESLDISSFNISNVIDMSYMFRNDSNLKVIYVGDNWTTENSLITEMFENCGTDKVTLKSSIPINPIYASLYDDGTLVFSNTNDIIEDKTLVKSYDNVKETMNDIEKPWNAEIDNITKIDFATSVELESLENLLYGHYNLTEITRINNLDTANVTNMSNMFYGCSSLTNLELTSFDTTNVVDMSSMFEGCNNLTILDLTSFDTNKVMDMTKMFANCTNLNTIYVSGNWNLENANIDEMFSNCGVSEFTLTTDEELADSIYVMLYTDGTLAFSNNNKLLANKTLEKSYGDISDIYVDRALNNEYIAPQERPWYDDAEKVKNVEFINKISPVYVGYWFDQCKELEQIYNIQNLDTSRTVNMSGLFSECYKLTSLDLSNFDTSNVTSFMGMFYYCTGLTTLDLRSFDASNVAWFSSMFLYCTNLETLYLSQDWINDDKFNGDKQNMFLACPAQIIIQ